MKKDPLRSLPMLLLIILLAACGNPPATATSIVTATTATSEQEPPAATISPTDDPCSLPQVEAEVQKVHAHMREFDDASKLASNIPREQLSNSIADLQRIRREAEDESIPACLSTLKFYQIQHMNSVIETLIAFMGGSIDQQTLDQAISMARQQHDQYTLELAKVLGLTVVPVTPPSVPSETPAP